MLSYDEALAVTVAAARPLPGQSLPLAKAAGLVLAAPLTAAADSPAASTSAMDGYAVRSADVEAGPAALTLVGQSLPGAPHCGHLAAGEAVRIFTGAAVPPGADRILIQERAVRDGAAVLTAEALSGPGHIRAAGSDFRAGETLLSAGRRLTPRAMVAAACADAARVQVIARPRVAVLATGDELAAPGQARLTRHAIPESVSFGVAAMAEAWGGAVVMRRRLRDDRPVLEAAAAEALAAADLVVVTGGASVGERDFAKAMFDVHGLDLLVAKVAIKPGKPVWLGRAGGVLILGLPGNPTSAMVTARLFLAPLLCGLGGDDPGSAIAWRETILAGDLPPPGERETFVRARRTSAGAEPLSDQDSGAQRALANADLLIRRPAGAAALGAGSTVLTLDF